jgi:putative transposase
MLYLILRREGCGANHQRGERLYREEGLSLRRRRRRQRLSHLRVVRAKPTAVNQTWAVEFIHDSLFGGRRLRAFAVRDQWSRESLASEVESSLTGERVARVVDRLRSARGVPAVMQADHGPELRGRILAQWPYAHRVKLQFIAPGKPLQNAYLESFNARRGEECFDQHVFLSIEDARTKIERWRVTYHRERPHSVLGNLTPAEFAATAQSEASSAPARTAWPAPAKLVVAAHGAIASDSNLTVFRSPSDSEGWPEKP